MITIRKLTKKELEEINKKVLIKTDKNKKENKDKKTNINRNKRKVNRK